MTAKRRSGACRTRSSAWVTRARLWVRCRTGPEDPIKVLGPAANCLLRFWNDVTATYKLNDKWAFTGEANYFKDKGIKAANGGLASAYGFDGYIAYTINDQATFNLRGEIYRDNTGLLTTEFSTNSGFHQCYCRQSGCFRQCAANDLWSADRGIDAEAAIPQQ